MLHNIINETVMGYFTLMYMYVSSHMTYVLMNNITTYHHLYQEIHNGFLNSPHQEYHILKVVYLVHLCIKHTVIEFKIK